IDRVRAKRRGIDDRSAALGLRADERAFDVDGDARASAFDRDGTFELSGSVRYVEPRVRRRSVGKRARVPLLPARIKEGLREAVPSFERSAPLIAVVELHLQTLDALGTIPVGFA